MENYFVSIIIPIYKVEAYIERCLNSVMFQDSSAVSIECVLVDDCSPDNSMIIAKNLIKNYSGTVSFKIISHEKNKGLSAARNTGMKYASGDFFYFLDSDDYISEDCIMHFYNAVMKYPDVEVVKGNHKGRIQINTSKIPSCLLHNKSILNLLYTGVIPVMAWNTLIKRTVINNANLVFIAGMIYEDNLWTVQLFRNVNSFLFIPDVTYYYEENGNSITGNSCNSIQAKALPHFIIMIDELMSSFDSKHFVPYTFFIISRMMQMIDLILKDRSIDSDLIEVVLNQRNRLLMYTFQNCRFILVLFEFLLYPPLWYLMKLRVFRRNYDSLVKIVYKIAMIRESFYS